MDNKIKVFYDAEFTGLHKNSELISIGLLSDTNYFFYAEFNDFSRDSLSDWIKENVIANLRLEKFQSSFPKQLLSIMNQPEHIPYPRKCFDCVMKGNREEIAHMLRMWLNALTQGYGVRKQVQFYTDCYAYDWVLLNDLICDKGDALNLPAYCYYIPMDLSTALQLNDVDPDVNREEFASDGKVQDLVSYYSNVVIDSYICSPSVLISTDESGDEIIPKHNSLWDAYICRECFTKLRIV